MKGPQAALFYALGEDRSLGLSKSRQEYGRIAAEAMMQAIRENNPRTSPDDPVLYDWAYGALTHDEKRAFVNFCKSRIGKEVRVHNGKSHGYRCPRYPQGLIALLSFYGDGIDDSYAETLLIQGTPRVLAVAREIYKRGKRNTAIDEPRSPAGALTPHVRFHVNLTLPVI